ncbi:MAG: DNA replication protein DnaD [Bacteroidota bacterium]|nr:DNA replication protein DnaD [Bacteroidota bacterium]
MHGWIKVHRTLLEKPIWKQSTPEHKAILITILLMANHEKNEWEWNGIKCNCKPGEFITSVQSIINNAGKGISRQNVRTALSRFEKLEFLTIQSTKQSTKITICNWESYQGVANISQPTIQPKANQDLTTNKKDKNVKNKKVDTDFEFFFNQYHTIIEKPKTDRLGTFKKWGKLTSEERNKAIEMLPLYANSIPDKKYAIMARTYLENKRFNDEFENILKTNNDNEKPNKPTFIF